MMEVGMILRAMCIARSGTNSFSSVDNFKAHTELEQLMRLAKLGQAVEKAFENKEIALMERIGRQEYITIADNSADLLEWYEQEGTK